MNQTKKTILLAVLFAGILAGATVSYNYLSAGYTPPSDAVVLHTPETSPKDNNPSDSDPAETEEPASTETTAEIDTSAKTDAPAPETEAEETESPFTPAPDFTVRTRDGKEVRLSDYVGKPVIINFWATWSRPCKSELPAFNEAYQTYGDAVHFLMVNLTDGVQDTVEKVTAFVDNGGYTFPLLFDTESEGAMTYGAYSIPLTVFVDAKGNLLGGHRGAMSGQTLEEYISILLTYYAEP